MDAHDLFAWHGEHAEGIILAQCFLGGEREPGQIREILDVVRVNAGLVEVGLGRVPGTLQGQVGLGDLFVQIFERTEIELAFGIEADAPARARSRRATLRLPRSPRTFAVS